MCEKCGAAWHVISDNIKCGTAWHVISDNIKCGTAWHIISDNIIRRMRMARGITKATDIHSECENV
jgi:hypothetical protein